MTPTGRDIDLAADVVARGIERKLAGKKKRRPEPSRTFYLDTKDGHRLGADLYLPSGPPKKKLLLASAMGVARGYYAHFAAEMAAHGIATLTFDYRGIAASLHGPLQASKARLHEWGELDMAAATRELLRLGDDAEDAALRDLPLGFVGHSVGGQMFGLMRDLPFERALFVGSQAGYFGHWNGVGKLGMAALWFVGIPLFTTTLGYLPMRLFGQGEDIPKGVAREWATWGRDPRYVGLHVEDQPEIGYATFTGKIRSLSIADDAYAPPRAVRALCDLYRAADVDVVTLKPADVGASSIGHFGFFKDRFRESLFADASRFLLGEAPASA
jgi:predicted alpha/beta hydrolase